MSGNNKRIAKNTIILYFRMLIIMAVSLYTVRVVLSVLGQVDYGIYNVVGGIVIMFSFLSTTMASASQRFFSFEIGRDNMSQLRRTFNMTVIIYIIIAVILLILAETIGLWFLNVKMNIPLERMIAVNWVYQLSIISLIFTIIAIPFNAIILAHEKMKVYAFVTVISALLKLLFIYLLVLIVYDKLKLYSVLTLGVTIITSLMYIIYCRKNFKECQYFVWEWDKLLFKELFNYSGWNVVGVLASIGKNEGLNILLNIFFNPIVNASMAIAMQINGTISRFISNLYVSTRPQITKYYANEKEDEMWKLIFLSSKIAFYSFIIIGIPIFLEIEFILKFWLGEYPTYTPIFIRLLLLNFMLETIYNQLISPLQAANKLKKIQLFDSIIILLVLPISYIIFQFNLNPIIPFVIMNILSFCRIFTSMLITKKEVNLSLENFLNKVLYKEFSVLIFSILLPLLFLKFTDTFGFQRLLLVVMVSVISTIISIWFIGLESSERVFMKIKTQKVVKKIKLKR